MARCRHYNVLTEMVMDMPLLMANGTFRYLDLMQDKELEVFLSYLVRFTAEKDSNDPTKRPKWWGKDLEFTPDFHLGTTSLPYSKHKPMKLRKAIKSCYSDHNAMSILALSEKFASKGSSFFLVERNTDDTATISWRIDGKKCPIAVIPQSNLEYELHSSMKTGRTAGMIMNFGLKRHVQNNLIRKHLIEYCQPFSTMDDSDDDDCIMMIQDLSSSEDEESTCQDFPPIDGMNTKLSLGKTVSSTFLNSQGDLARHRRTRKGQLVIDLTLEEDEVELAALREKEKSDFLQNLKLIRPGSARPAYPHRHEWRPKKKTRFSLKKFTIDQVPYLVRIGLIPRRCLCSMEEISRCINYVEKYLL